MTVSVTWIIHIIVIIHSFASLVLAVFSAIAPFWYSVWLSNSYGGLFIFCEDSICDTISGTIYRFIHITRGFIIASAAGNFLAFFVLFAAAKCRKRRKLIQRCGAGLLILASVFATVALSFFTARYTEYPDLQTGNFSYSYCYVLGWVSTGMSMLFGIVSLAFPLPDKCHEADTPDNS